MSDVGNFFRRLKLAIVQVEASYQRRLEDQQLEVRMGARKLMRRIAEVSYEGRIDEYEVIAYDNVQARDLVITHLGADETRKSIRVRDLPGQVEGEPRVIGRTSGPPT